MFTAMKLSTTLLAASILTAAAALPQPSTAAATEYHYYLSDGKEIELLNHSLPITVGGVAVGVTELPLIDASASAPGERITHDLSSGHHFGHKDWFLNGSLWEYQEGYEGSVKSRHPSPEPRSLVKTSILISGVVDEVDYELSSGTDYIEESAYIHSVTGLNPPFFEIEWTASGICWVNLWSTDDVTRRPFLTVEGSSITISNTAFYAFGIQPM